MGKRFLRVSVLCAFAFLWGYLSHRQSFFPHPQFQSIGAAFGFGKTVLVKPRSGQLSLLRSLPYVQSTYDAEAERRGVLVHDENKAFAGYTFYNSGFRNEAALIDMDGSVVHKWSRNLGPGGWHHAELLRSGEILVVVEDESITRLALDSTIVWQYRTRAHHGLWVGEDGTIYVLSRDVGIRPEIHPEIDTVADKIVTLGPDGTFRAELPLLDILQSSTYRFLLPRIRMMEFERNAAGLDVLHANQVEVFDGRLEHVSPLYKRGNILVSMKHINSVAIIDGETKEVVWLWGPTNIALQHHSRLLDNGNILLFDNGLEGSRVLEMNPLTMRMSWKYEGDGLGRPFYSSWGGSNQRLPNGNTLITETATGYGFEVTPNGELVWQFANPEVAEDGKRTNIWRMTRFVASDLDFL